MVVTDSRGYGNVGVVIQKKTMYEGKLVHIHKDESSMNCHLKDPVSNTGKSKIDYVGLTESLPIGLNVNCTNSIHYDALNK